MAITKLGNAEVDKHMLKTVFKNTPEEHRISARQILDHMKTQYGLDEPNVVYMPNSNYSAFYTSGKSLAKIKKHTENPNWFTKLVTGKHGAKERKDLAKALEHTTPGKHTLLVSKNIWDNHPGVVGHEVGHVANRRNPKLAPYIDRLRGAATLGIPAGIYAHKIRRMGLAKVPTPLIAGLYGLGAIGMGTTLADEYFATKKAKKALKELGIDNPPDALRRGFNSYLVSNGIVAASAALPFIAEAVLKNR
jgi:hypothetical protein